MSNASGSRPLSLTPLLALGLAALLPGGTAAATPGTVDSKWFPLVPGTQFVYNGTVIDEDGTHSHRVVFTVTDLVKRVDGRLAVVAWDRDFQDGELTEAELALFVQDANGDVRTMGEYPEEYENGEVRRGPQRVGVGAGRARRQGSWYRATRRWAHRRSPRGARRRWTSTTSGQVFRRGAHVCAPAGCFDRVTVIQEWSPLAPEDGQQLKYYAPGVGLVRDLGRGRGLAGGHDADAGSSCSAPTRCRTRATRPCGWTATAARSATSGRRRRRRTVADRQVPGSTLITRASTTTMTDSAMTDCTAIRPLTRRVSGSVSVGLNATTVVNDR